VMSSVSSDEATYAASTGVSFPDPSHD
jgi:hypothetical protein